MNDVLYERPESLAQARVVLKDAPDDLALLAGGTDLGIKLRAGVLNASLILDIKRIPEVREINWGSDGAATLGACVTMRELYQDERLCEQYPGLTDGAEAVGSLQIRCRATVGGNLCNASPCMDTAPALLLLDASMHAVGPDGERDIPLREFFVDVKKTALKAREIVTAVHIPAASKSLRTAFDKIKRVRGHDLALVNAAAAYDPDKETLRAVIGSCGKTPVMTPAVGATGDAADKLAAAALETICPIDDVRASAEYRRDMAALLCRRLAATLLAGRQS